MVPEPTHKAEEGPGQRFRAALGGVGDGGHLQCIKTPRAGPAPHAARSAGAPAALWQRHPGCRPARTLHGHGQQRKQQQQQWCQLWDGRRQSPSTYSDELRDGGRPPELPISSRPVQLPHALSAWQRGHPHVLQPAFYGREPTGTVCPLPELVCF